MMIAHEKSKWIIKICTSRERNIRFCWEKKKSMNGERRSMPRTKINKNSLLEEESTSQSNEIDFSIVGEPTSSNLFLKIWTIFPKICK